MAEWMLDNTFECPRGYVQDYNDCKHQHHEECTECERWKRILAEKAYLNYLLNEYGVDCLWISVKERLPTDMGTVLIAHKGGVSFGWFNGNYWTRGAATKHRPIKTVTHWMPLPEPPKKQDDT